MPTQDIFIFEPKTAEQAEALKAFGTALKLKFEISKNQSETLQILYDLREAVTEINLVKKGN